MTEKEMIEFISIEFLKTLHTLEEKGVNPSYAAYVMWSSANQMLELYLSKDEVERIKKADLEVERKEFIQSWQIKF